jgi:HSP20 family molecular chaperone IbpA
LEEAIRVVEGELQMANIVVQKVRETDIPPSQLLDEIESFTAKIRQRAYDLFEMRGGIGGHEVDDWLQAERELMWQPGTELNEREDEFQARINTPDLQPKDLRIIAFPTAIFLAAEPARANECRRVKRLDLPAPIDPDRVLARLDKGLLQITAPKMRQAARAA